MSEALNELVETVRAIAKLNPQEDLVREEELGRDFHFGDQLPLFGRVVSLFGDLEKVEFSNLPDGQIRKLNEAAGITVSSLREIVRFKPGKVPNPTHQREEVVNQLERTYERVFPTVSAAVAYASSRDTGSRLREAREAATRMVGEIEEIKRRADKDQAASLQKAEQGLSHLQKATEAEMRTLQEDVKANAAAAATQVESQLEASRQNAEAKLREYEKSAEGIVKRIRRSAGAAAVGKRADMFGKEAQRHAAAKRTWLRASIGVAALAVLFALGNVVYLAFCGDPEIDPGPAIELAVAKILLFSVLYFALVWVVRTYRAASHNEIVNQHRRNALLTFETFVAATSDDQTKEAVLLRATESVFGHQVSGFSDPGRDDGGSSKWLEVIRGVRSGADER